MSSFSRLTRSDPSDAGHSGACAVGRAGRAVDHGRAVGHDGTVGRSSTVGHGRAVVHGRTVVDGWTVVPCRTVVRARAVVHRTIRTVRGERIGAAEETQRSGDEEELTESHLKERV